MGSITFPSLLGLYFGYLPLRAELFPPDGLLFLQGGKCSGEFVTPLRACALQGGVHLCNGIPPITVRHLLGPAGGACLFVADACVGIASPVAGGHGSASVDSRYAAYIDGAASRTAHAARGIAAGQGGRIRATCHTTGYIPGIHCGRGAASGKETVRLIAYCTTSIAVDAAVADAAPHRAVFNLTAIAPFRHAADVARIIAFYLHVLQHHVLHRAVFADEAEQARIVVTSRNGQSRDGMAAAVESAGVLVVMVYAYRCPVDACQVDVVGQGAVQREVALRGFSSRLQAVGGGDCVGLAIL